MSGQLEKTRSRVQNTGGGLSVAVFIKSYKDVAAFRPERFNPVPVAANERIRVMVASFEPGQFIPVHRPGVDLTLLVLEGTGTIIAGDGEQPVGPGSLAFVPAGEARGVKAESRLVILHVVAPPPTEADHGEVAAGFQRGTWR